MFLITVFPPKQRNILSSDFISIGTLTVIASTLDKVKFSEDELLRRFIELTIRYAARKDDNSEPLQLGTYDKGAFLYLGYANVFLLTWLLTLFFLPPAAQWRSANPARFGIVTVLLALFLASSWVRTRQFLELIPASTAFYIASMVQTDEAMAPLLAAAEVRRAEIQARIETLRHQWRRFPTPSLLGYLKSKLEPKSTGSFTKADHASRLPGWYHSGEKFAQDTKRNQCYDEEWLPAYAGYVFYRVARVVGRAVSFAFVLVLQATGLTEWMQLEVARRRLNARPNDLSTDAELWQMLRQASRDRAASKKG